MRIRKHARNLAPSVSPSPTVSNPPDTQACHLNRSPWDVLAFTQEFEHQVNIEDEYTCNSSDGREPLYASNSMASREEGEEEEYNEMEKRFSAGCVKKKGKKKIGGKKEFNYIRCGKIDGKGWQCKKEAKQGEVLCEHHILQLESYKHKYNYSYTSRKAEAVPSKTKTVEAANKKRNKGRISSAPPADFYFYSGFGPSWGRNRAGGNEAIGDKETIDAANQTSSSSEVHISDGRNRRDDVDLIVDDFFSEDDEENGGTKKTRKPIKARSLKSLF